MDSFARKKCGDVKENYEITTKSWEFIDNNFDNFTKIKVFIENQAELPSWRERKNKKPMIMIDEVELYKK